MVVDNMSKHCFISHFLCLLVTDFTLHFSSSLSELGHRIRSEKSRRFKTETFERSNVATLDFDFKLKRSSDPLAYNGNKINILKALITKLK